MKAIFDAGLLFYKLETLQNFKIDDYYLRILLVNDIDTNFISVFIPEIYKNGSNFVTYDSRGVIIPKPCEVLI